MAALITLTPPEYFNYRYVNGTYQGTTQRYSLDPNDTPINFFLRSSTVAPGVQTNASIRINLYDSDFGVAPFFVPIDILEGTNITIGSETFVASDNPNSANEFFSVQDATSTTQRGRWADSFADVINSNLNLNWQINATAIKDNVNNYFAVQLDAKYPGSAYTFFLNPVSVNNGQLQVSSTTGIITSVFTVNIAVLISANIPGTNASFGDELKNFNYGVFVEVYEAFAEWASLPFSPELIKIAELFLPYRRDNDYRFDIANFLTALMQWDMTPYQTMTANPQFVPIQKGINAYVLKYGEKYSGGIDFATNLPLMEVNNTFVSKYYSGQTEIRWTSKGAYPYNALENQHPQYWYQLIQGPSNKNVIQPIYWLSNAPEYKLRRRTNEVEPYYVYLLNDQEISSDRSYRSENVWHHVDGTTTTTFSNQANFQNSSNLYQVNLSKVAMGFDAVDVVNRVLYSEHYVQQNRGNGIWLRITNKLGFEWDLNTEVLNKYLKVFFRSEVGAFESFEFEGVENFKVNSDSTDYQRSFTYDRFVSYQRDKKVMATYRNNTTYEITLNSGMIDAAHLDWLIDLLNSPEIFTTDHFLTLIGFNVYQPVGQFVAIKKVGYNYAKNSIDKLFNLEFTFIVAIPENTLKN